MKKIVIFCVLVLVGTLSFAQKSKLNIDWENLQTINYPIILGNANGDIISFNQPNDLAIYCAYKSEKYISSARNMFLAGTGFSVLGRGLLAASSNSSRNNADILLSFGSFSLIIGAICDIICINDLFQFAKWNHREKAVQFTVKPTGVALSF